MPSLLPKIDTVIPLALPGSAMAQEPIRISSDWGDVSTQLTDNDAARAFARMLPLAIEPGDHLNQEKVNTLPSALPDGNRQRDFSAGMLGLWADDHFVIYYRSGRVPPPGIVVLGHVPGDVSVFDRPGPVTVDIRRAERGGPDT